MKTIQYYWSYKITPVKLNSLPVEIRGEMILVVWNIIQQCEQKNETAC